MEQIRKQMKLITVLVSLTLLLSVLTFAGNIVISNKLDGGAVVPTPSQPSAGTGTGNAGAQPTSDVSVDDDPVLGDKNAPVTIIEFSDYQCPFCKRFWSQTLPSIKSTYIDTGKVKFVYRDFPLSMHPMAQISAEAAECVRDQGGEEVYWEMHDKIFAGQSSLSQSALEGWAQDLGYDISSCLNDGKFKSEVQKDFADGSAAGVSGTPTFFINGKILSGAQPFSAFQQVIDAEL